jgi:hypothetical protein
MNSKYDDDEEFPYSSADLTPALPAPQSSRPAAGSGEFTVEDYRTALRLLVGSLLEGNDELRERLKIWQETIQEREQEGGGPQPEAEEIGGSQLFYSFLGLLFKTPDYLNKGTSTASHISSRAASVVSTILRPITHSWFLRPVRRRYHVLVARGESVVSSLEQAGRAEARNSRVLIRRQVSDETIEEILGYIVEKAKLRELIAEQGVEVTTDAVTEVRVRSAGVDSSLDNIVDNILRRQKSRVPPPSSS